MEKFKIQIYKHLQVNGEEFYTGKIFIKKIFKLFWFIPISYFDSYLISIDGVVTPTELARFRFLKKFKTFTEAHAFLQRKTLEKLKEVEGLKEEEVIKTTTAFLK